MRIAITGGTGLLGRYFVMLLLERGGYEPIIISRKSLKFDNGLETRKTDYSFPDLVEILSDIDAVIHLAAKRSNCSDISFYDVNSHLTQNIYAACQKNQIRDIIYSSSITVYSNDIPLPWSEQQQPSPSTTYGISKLSSEYIGNLYRRDFGLRIVNLRFPPLFGVLTTNDKMLNRMIYSFITKAMKKETLVLFSEQNAKREYLYAKDAARALFCVLEKEDKNHYTYNIGIGDAFTNQEVAETINLAFHNVGNIRVENRKERLLVSSYMKCERASSELGYKPEFSLLEAMKDLFKEMTNVQ